VLDLSPGHAVDELTLGHQHGAAWSDPLALTAPQLAVMACLERVLPDYCMCAWGAGRRRTVAKRSAPKGWLGCALRTGWTAVYRSVGGELQLVASRSSRLSGRLELCRATQPAPVAGAATQPL